MHSNFANTWNSSKYPKELQQAFLIVDQWQLYQRLLHYREKIKGQVKLEKHKEREWKGQFLLVPRLAPLG